MKTLLILLSMALVTNSYASERKFCRAVIKNKIEKVKDLLKTEPTAINYNCKYKGNTFLPLTWSHLKYNQKMSELLLKNGADISDSLKEYSLINLLIRVRNNPNCRYVYHCSLIDYLISIPNIADSLSSTEVAEILRSSDYPLKLESKLTFIKNLYKDGFDFTQTVGDNQNSFLFFANRIDVLKLLMSYDLNPNFKNAVGDTFFTNALKYKAPQDFLLSAAQIPSVKINEMGSNNDLPLFISLQRKMKSLFDYLFTRTSPAANSTDSYGKSFLHYSFNDLEQTSFFLARGTDINIVDREGQTALFLAVKANDKDAIFYLLENGACKNVINTQGRTPLSYAIDNNNAEIIELLSKYPSGC